MNNKKIVLVWCIVLVVAVGGWVGYSKFLNYDGTTNRAAVNASVSNNAKAATATNQVTLQDVGKSINLDATVVSKYLHPKGHIFTTLLLKNGQELDMPIFNSIKINEADITVGSIVKITGEIKEYKGKLQIVPNKSDDIKIVKKMIESDIKTCNIADITLQDRGKMVKVKGCVVDISEGKGHTYFNIADVNNSKTIIKAVLFKAEYEELTDRKVVLTNSLNNHIPVWVIGTVSTHENKLSIIADKIFVE